MRREDQTRSGGRGVAVLATVALVTLALTPAFSAFSPTKAKVKKIAKKQATKVLNQAGPGLFIEEGELVRFGPVTAGMGDSEKTVHTFGPYTISLLCEDDAGDVRIRVQIATSSANSSVNTDTDDEGDFDPEDTDVDIEETLNGAPGDPQALQDEDAQFAVASSGGTTAYYGSVLPATNFGGGHCWVSGWVLQVL